MFVVRGMCICWRLNVHLLNIFWARRCLSFFPFFFSSWNDNFLHFLSGGQRKQGKHKFFLLASWFEMVEVFLLCVHAFRKLCHGRRRRRGGGKDLVVNQAKPPTRLGPCRENVMVFLADKQDKHDKYVCTPFLHGPGSQNCIFFLSRRPIVCPPFFWAFCMFTFCELAYLSVSPGWLCRLDGGKYM